MAFRIFIHILIPALFFLSFQFKSAGIAFIPIYSFMLYFLAPKRKPFRSAFLIFFVFWLLMLYWLLFINVD
ncbi:MAG: hypothetical protein PHW02_06305, partial [bacterium]|nr:hypothetical protein [bacterium]